MKILRKRTEWANQLNAHENQILQIKNKMSVTQSQVTALKTLIDADVDATASDKAFMVQANNLVTNIKVQDFIDYITTQIG